MLSKKSFEFGFGDRTQWHKLVLTKSEVYAIIIAHISHFLLLVSLLAGLNAVQKGGTNHG